MSAFVFEKTFCFFPFTEVFYNYLYLNACYEAYLFEAFKSIYFWKCLANFLETSY